MPGPGAAARVPAAADGERLDRFVALATGCSRSVASDALARGEVLLDGEVVTRASTRVREGQSVEMAFDPDPGHEQPVAQPEVGLKVVHEDASVIVVDKPAGLVVHPAPGHPEGTLCNALVARYPEILSVGDPSRPGIVHRLDRMTSGLMVVARTQQAHDALVEQLGARSVERVYSALVLGLPEASRGVVDAPVGRSRRDPTRMTVAAGAKEARTRFEVLERFEDPACALLSCRLETGRTHQIRVHMSSIGHPVAGDELYGGIREGVPSERMFLHAGTLAFGHPASGERVEFTSPLPEELARWLARLRT